MKDKQYAERDAMALDEAGGYYCRHVSAMTGEQLHSKGDIAAELGYRDMLIDQLTSRAEAAEAELTRRDAQEPVGEVVDVGGALLVEWDRCLREGDKIYAAAPAAVLPQDPVNQAVNDAVEERTAAARRGGVK